jgi:chemotaxis protein CheC
MLTGNKAKRERDLATWSKLAHAGSKNAISGLSQMVSQEITVSTVSLEEVLPRNVTGLIGKENDKVVGIYLSFSGSSSGHIMLAFQPQTAFGLVDMAMGMPLGSAQELGEMERSALGEIGNVVGTFFLNTIADGAGQCLSPSPPVVSINTASAIMSSVMAGVMAQDNPIFGVRLLFSTEQGEISGRFLVLPVD